MVFIFASNFEFSAASSSTYCAFWSVGVLEAAGFSTAIEASDNTGLCGAFEALDVLGLMGAVQRRGPVVTIEKIAGSLHRLALFGRLRDRSIC